MIVPTTIELEDIWYVAEFEDEVIVISEGTVKNGELIQPTEVIRIDDFSHTSLVL